MLLLWKSKLQVTLWMNLTGWCAGKMIQARLWAEFRRNSVCSVKNGVFNDLSDIWSKKTVTFNVPLLIRAGFEIGILPIRQRTMKVLCMNLAVEFFCTKGTRKLVGGGNSGKGCSVHSWSLPVYSHSYKSQYLTRHRI